MTQPELLWRFVRALPALVGLVSIGACDTTEPATSSFDAALEVDGAVAAPDAAATDAGPDGDAATEPELTTMDSCHGEVCLPSRLPRQPSLPFLESMGDGWQRLMEADWDVAPSSEGYRCMTLTVPEDVLITAFQPQSPPGTHHATFGVSAIPAGPDDVVACGAGLVGERRLQGGGAGAESSELPPGVAMRLHKGEQIMMNLHLFNISDEPLQGRSGMWIKTAPAGEVVTEAETVLAGPLSLFIPVGRSTQSGTCTLRAAATVYSVAPHMHQKGVHMRATALKHGAGPSNSVELYDGNYDFNHQLVYSIEPVRLREGDVIHIECTYENDTDGPISWGDSSLSEMCFMGVSLYPSIGYGSLPCSM